MNGGKRLCAMDSMQMKVLYTTVTYTISATNTTQRCLRYFGRNGFRDAWVVPVPAGTSQDKSPLPPGAGPGRSSSRPSIDMAYCCASEISLSVRELLTVVPEIREDRDGARSTTLRMFTGFRGTGARGGTPVTCEYNDSVSTSLPPPLT